MKILFYCMIYFNTKICEQVSSIRYKFAYAHSKESNQSAYFMPGSRGEDRGSGTSLKNHKNIGFLSNIVPDSLENHKATEPAFNVRPSSAHQRKAI